MSLDYPATRRAKEVLVAFIVNVGHAVAKVDTTQIGIVDGPFPVVV